MKLAIVSAALLAFACSSGTTETRTAVPIPSSTYGATANNPPPPATQGAPVKGSPTAEVSQSTEDNNTGVRTITAQVAEIQKDGIRFGPDAGSMILKVDASTRILRAGVPVSEGLSAIHEGEQVRASFDAAQNHATQIDLMGRSTDLRQDKNGGEPHPQSSPPPSDANTTPH